MAKSTNISQRRPGTTPENTRIPRGRLCAQSRRSERLSLSVHGLRHDVAVPALQPPPRLPHRWRRAAGSGRQPGPLPSRALYREVISGYEHLPTPSIESVEAQGSFSSRSPANAVTREGLRQECATAFVSRDTLINGAGLTRRFGVPGNPLTDRGVGMSRARAFRDVNWTSTSRSTLSCISALSGTCYERGCSLWNLG